MRKIRIIAGMLILAFVVCVPGQKEVQAKSKTKVYCVDPLGVKTFNLKKGTLTIKLASNRTSALYKKTVNYYDIWKTTNKRIFKYKVAKNIKYTYREGYSDPSGGRVYARVSYKRLRKYFKTNYSYEYPEYDWDCNCYIKIRNNKIIEVSLVDA